MDPRSESDQLRHVMGSTLAPCYTFPPMKIGLVVFADKQRTNRPTNSTENTTSLDGERKMVREGEEKGGRRSWEGEEGGGGM